MGLILLNCNQTNKRPSTLGKEGATYGDFYRSCENKNCKTKLSNVRSYKFAKDRNINKHARPYKFAKDKNMKKGFSVTLLKELRNCNLKLFLCPQQK